MGQRHQLFVIAKILGRYRSLAALHHQWLYGLGAVKSCERIVRLFQDTSNRHLLEHELDYAKKLPREIWAEKVDRSDRLPKFPFVTTCLVLGASLDVETGYSSHVLLLPWNLEFDQGDNNDGVTIIDITRPSDVRYCFVFYEDDFGEGRVTMTPLSAEEYLKAYEGEESDGSNSTTHGLGDVPVIDVQALEEAWPRDGKWYDPVLRDPTSTEMSDDGVAESESTQRPPSLEDLSTKAVIEDALVNGVEDLDIAADIPLFSSKLRTYIHDNPKVVEETSFGFAALKHVVQKSRDLDLRPWPQLSAAQILELVSSAAESDLLDTLDVSGLQHLTAESLTEILEFTSITRIYLWDNASIPVSLVTPFLLSGKLKRLFHSSLFRAFAHESDIAFTYHRFSIPATSFPAADPPINSIKQLVWLKASPGLHDCPVFKSRALSFSEEVRRRIQELKWDKFETSFRYQFFTAVLPLQDTFFGAEGVGRVLSGISQFLAQISSPLSYTMEPQMLGIAKAFSLAGKEVHPIPPTLYSVAQSAYHQSSNQFPVTMQPLKRNEWTVLLIQESPFEEYEDPPPGEIALPDSTTNCFHYAFVSINEQDEFIQHDLPGFLEHVLGVKGAVTLGILTKNWEDAITGIQSNGNKIGFKICEKEMTEDVLKLMDILTTKQATAGFQWGTSKYGRNW